VILSTCAAARRAEARARNLLSLPEDLQMERASVAAWDLFRELFPDHREFAVVCGPGSNGGDGIALARHALLDGFRPTVLFAGAHPPEGSLASLQLLRLRALGLDAAPRAGRPGLPSRIPAVDALFGTGLSRPLDAESSNWAAWLSARPTLSLDLPSGLDGDTGRPRGDAVRARATLCFGRAKPGVFLDPGRSYAGEVRVAPIGIPVGCWEGEDEIRLLDADWARGRLTPRPRHAHKGTAGRCLLLCGSDRYRGAAILAASAALRSGAGLLVVGSTAAVANSIAAAVPEAMGRVALGPGAEPLADLLEGARAVLAGPGLGRGPEVADLLSALLEAWSGPLVLDADALNIVGARDDLRERLASRPTPAVLTPHPGEAARLSGESVEEILADPLAAARGMASRLGAVVVLKTSTPVVASPAGDLALGCAGHPGMATGGTGDALAGVLTARLAEGEEPFGAACQAVRAHARAADLAGENGRRGMSVVDLVGKLPAAWEEMEPV
jgi:NAD(P)H-hydrate epimerase